MSNQLAIAGAQNDKPTQYTPLRVDQFFTGYWPNRNPLRDAATSFLVSKFYSGTRNDSILDGLNTEISPRMTLVRRPGLTVYNSQSFTDVAGFASFKPFQPGLGEQVHVIVDTPGTVYDGTGPSTKTALLTKSAGSGNSTFLGVENTLLISDGVDNSKWSWFPAWVASNLYGPGSVLLDPSNNLQQVLGRGWKITSTSFSTTGNILTVNYTGTGTPAVGETVTLVGLTTETALNNVVVTVATSSAGVFTATGFSTASSYSTTADAGVVYDPNANGTSGGTIPTFSGVIGTVLLDGTLVWISRGTSVQNAGIAAPTAAPTLTTIPVSAGAAWAASTYYWPTPLIFDGLSGTIQSLTTSGTLASSPPTFSATLNATTTDGGAVWTCISNTPTRAINTAYTVGQIILVSVVITTKEIIGFNPATKQPIYGYSSLTYPCFFQCTTAGTSSALSTSKLGFTQSLGATTADGTTLIWTNIGYEVTRSTATTSPVFGSSGVVSGTVGNSLLVSNNTTIVDVATNGENVVWAGKSNVTAAPTFSTALGGQTNDNGPGVAGLIWKNTGPSGTAQTLPWVYAFSYENPATGDESTASDLSTPIILPANSAIVVSGMGSPDTQVGIINIYRSTEGFTTPFLLASIPAPLNGQSWQFQDNTLDPPNPGATLNDEITASGYAVSNGLVFNFNDPPPAGLTNLAFHAGRVWGSTGNIAYYSTGPDVTVGNGITSWDVENFYEFPGTIFRFWPTTVGLYIFTNDGTWLITGLGIAGTSTSAGSPFSEPQLVDPATSINSYYAFDFSNASALAYTTDNSFITIDATNGTSNAGEPVWNVLQQSYPPASVYVAYHRNGIDTRAFVTNGSNTWLNYMSVPAPETGFCWSPPATLVNSGGVKAVQSIETASGVFNLLVGPSGTGPLLKRDTTAFTDNGTAYDAFVVIGNIVLAHPGQMAGIAFIETDAVKTGSEPTVSFLMDELYGQAATPAFNLLSNPVNDPPKLDASSTIYALRYFLVTSQQPCWCRHMIMRFDFNEDTVQNEILSYCLYGKWVAEK